MLLKRLSLAVLLLAGFFTQDAFSQRREADIFVGKCGAQCDAQYATITEALAEANRRVGEVVIEIVDDAVYSEQVTISRSNITIRSTNPTSRPKPTIRFRDTLNIHPRDQSERVGCGDNIYVSGSKCSGNWETNGTIRIIRVIGVTLDGLAIDGVSGYSFNYNSLFGSGSNLYHGSAGVGVANSGNVAIRNCDIFNAYYGIAVKDRNPGGIFPNKNTHDTDDPIPLSSFGTQGGHLIERNRIYHNSVGYHSESAWDLASTIRFNIFYQNFHQPGTTFSLDNGQRGTWSANGLAGYGADRTSGAIALKDQFLSPLAIYNNTFYENAGDIIAKGRTGGQQLIFNNIFGQMSNREHLDNAGARRLESLHPHRIHNSVLSNYARGENIQDQSQNVQNCPSPGVNTPIYFVNHFQGYDNFPTVGSIPQTHTAPNGCNRIDNAPEYGGLYRNTPEPTGVTRGFHSTANIRWLEFGGYRGANLAFDTLFQSVDITSSDFLRPKWDHPIVAARIKGQGWSLDGLFNNDPNVDIGAIQSTAPATIVARAIPTNVVMISGAAGTTATAEFNFQAYDAATGRNVTLTDIKVKMLRWVAPTPVLDPNDWTEVGNPAAVVLRENIRNYTNVAGIEVNMGANRIPFTIPAITNPDVFANRYGFFELVAEGTYGGRTITSDVSFLPYTRLRHVFEIRVLNAAGTQVISGGNVNCEGITGQCPRVGEVTAGEEYRLRVTAYILEENGTLSRFNGNINGIEFQLFLNNQSATMWVPPSTADNPFVGDPSGMTGGEKTWPVYFRTAGDEQIKAAGVGNIGGTSTGFLGVGSVKVKPGPPEKVRFITPGSRSLLANAQAEGGFSPALPIPLGAPFTVEIGVTDRFDNLVDQAVPMKLDNIDQSASAKERSCLVADLTSQNSNTDVTTGIVTFTVNVSCGVQGEWFDMRAEVTSGPASGSHDIGRLRVGRTQDRLYIFVGPSSEGGPGDYSAERGNIASWNPDEEVRETASKRVAIYVKAVSGGAVMERDFEVCLTATDPEIEFYDAASGGNRLNDVSIELNNGEGVVWITAMTEVDNASIEAFTCGVSANSINAAFPRSNIYFRATSSAIERGVVTARGNGSGVPDTMMIYFASQDIPEDKFGGNWPMPESAYLYWPAEVIISNPEVLGIRVESTAIEIADGEVGRQLRVVFPANSGHPTGYTSVLGSSDIIGGLKWTMGATAGSPVEWEKFRVADEIGPVISARGNAFNDAPMGRVGPMIMENIGGERQDTIMIQISETVADFGNVLTGASILHRKRGIAAPTDYILDASSGEGDVINVASVTPRGEWLYLALTGAGGANNIEEGDYIRFSHTKGIADRDGNEVQGNNRWVRITLKPLPPEIDYANSYYANVNTPINLVDQIKLKFNKEVDPYGWFDELSVDFAGVLAGNKLSDMEAGAINSVTDDPSAIEINLARAFPSVFGGNAAAIQNLTSGTMTLNIRYKKGEENPITNEWDPTHGVISDGATPVLVSHGNHKESNYVGAVLKVGAGREDGSFDMDTLVITYTERLNNSFSDNPRPLVFHRNDGESFTPVLEFLTQNTNVGGSGAGWHQVRYLVPEGGFGYPDGKFVTIDDSVSINANAPGPYITDLAGNGQMTVNNKKVPLRIENKVSWGLRIRNNPFKAGKGGRDFTTVVFTPMIKGATDLEATVKVMLYDNLGSLVRTDEFNLKDHGYENDKGAPCIDWKWDGRNKRGRFVGTGTYHLKAVLDMKSGAIDGGRDRTTEVRAIGFVR